MTHGKTAFLPHIGDKTQENNTPQNQEYYRIYGTHTVELRSVHAYLPYKVIYDSNQDFN